MPSQHTTDREEWYNRAPQVPEVEKSNIKIAPKAKGQLADGFVKKDMPAEPKQGHAQTNSERNSVGSRFTVGQQLHGKASPSSEESFVKPKASKETNAR